MKNKYYLNSKFLKQEIDDYNEVRDSMVEFCENIGINWRGTLTFDGKYKSLENEKILTMLEDHGFNISKWMQLFTIKNREIEKYLNSLRD